MLQYTAQHHNRLRLIVVIITLAKRLMNHFTHSKYSQRYLVQITSQLL